MGHRRPGHHVGDALAERFTVVEMPASLAKQPAAYARAIRTFRPTLIHAHSSWAGTYGRVIAQLSGTPVVYTPHCYSFLRTDVSRAARLAFTVAEFSLARLTNVFVTAGPAETAETRRLRRRAVVYEATPAMSNSAFQEIASARLVAAGNEPTWDIATSGRVCHQKDPELFARTVEELHQMGWRGRAVWIGGGDPIIESRLRSAGVEVTGWVTRAQVLENLGRARTYVHTAAWEAGIPYSAVEAAAIGLPVVARAIPSLTDRPGVHLFDTHHDGAARIMELLHGTINGTDSKIDSAALSGELWKNRQREALEQAYEHASRNRS
ncbi:glycosyltransferase [Cellulomonas phragmiteti]|uniref:glycosyltransferase n=1 Tax=Cellulomonas phragmiteti TaxID=478780 RepID=UPI0035ED3C2D